jgi:hypothetical protein
MFSHDNLLACCKGGTNRNFAADALNKPEYYLEPKKDNRSCGEAKGKMPSTTFIDPRDIPALPPIIRVDAAGHISPVVNNCIALGYSVDAVEDHIHKLGLNVGRLRNQRKKIMEELSLLGDDSSLLQAFARLELLPDAQSVLKPFFSTTRSFFGPFAEKILTASPHKWV